MFMYILYKTSDLKNKNIKENFLIFILKFNK